MEEKSLKILGADKTFFSKISTTISKLLIPTKIGLNGMLITMKRNSLIKVYENYKNLDEQEEVSKRDAMLKKYEDAYALYLESIDKYIMDSVYKKVKNGTASDFERDALSKYYIIINLKENEYIEYKYRKQKYLLELDYETVKNTQKEKTIENYEGLYIEKMDTLYKGILKNYAVKLADNLSNKFESRDQIFEKIFETIEEYVDNILRLKVKREETQVSKEVLEEYDKYERFDVGKLDAKDYLEKNMILLGISRKLFTHSLPLVVAEQCYIKLLKDARQAIVMTRNEKKREKMYEMFIDLIDDYNVKLLSTKVYWEKPVEREEYKKFWEQYKKIAETKKQNLIKFMRDREILFLKYDLKKLNASKHDYRNIIALHKEKLVKYKAMRNLKNSYKTIGNVKYIKKGTLCKERN